MAENKNNFDATVASLFKGMDSFVSAKTVVGDAVTVNDTIILPLVDVSFGVGAGAFAGEKKNNAGGAMTGKMSPSAVLVIHRHRKRSHHLRCQSFRPQLGDGRLGLGERQARGNPQHRAERRAMGGRGNGNRGKELIPSRKSY